jgi:hydrogenase maturation protein HypF
VPRLITLKEPVNGTVLGVGGDLKSAPALARERDVHLAPFMGDLDDEEAFRHFKTQVDGLQRLYGARADTAVCDLHPLYRSTLWAEEAAFPRLVAVQHHYAHVLSVMAEHGLEEAVGLAFDGTGYGTDGTIWGGEFLSATRGGFRRLGSFRPFPLPGADAAVLHPPRIAFAIAADRAREPGPRTRFRDIPGISAKEGALVRAMIEKRVNSPFTSSLGRIFDAAAAALGLVERTSYEGEGPIRLEGLALERRMSRPAVDEALAEKLLPFLDTRDGDLRFSIDSAPLIRHLLERRQRESPGGLALLFHHAVARASLTGARRARDLTGAERVVLCGGVFQNLLLRELLIPLLKEDGFRVFLNERVPPGDGGLSLGQVYYAPQ